MISYSSLHIILRESFGRFDREKKENGVGGR